MAGSDVRQHFGHFQSAVAFANLRKRFRRLKSATAAPADVIPAKQRPLRAGECFQHGAHR
jgi:hypothetical protein